MTPNGPPRRPSFGLLLILFFLSGCSALVYQVLWMRLLALVFGVTVHAASAVLAAFMAGLALGSAAAGRLADRVRAPLRAFAIAEALVAAGALATPTLLGAVERLYVGVHGTLTDAPLALGIIRFTLSFLVLIVPTTVMGATLPLVVKSALGRGTILGRQISLLYAVNTAGAIAGALIAGIWLIPQLGIAWSFRLGAALNVIVALAALALSARRAPEPAAPDPGPAVAAAAAPPAAPVDRRVRQLVLLTFAVSGFVSFALEIIWFRMLVVLLHPTTYAFTVMLATVLAGIALGSWLSTPFTRRRGTHALAVIAALEVLLAIAAVVSMAVIGRAGDVYAWAAPLFADGRLAYFGPMAITSIAAILPAALLMGMAFPIGIAIWASDVEENRAGERVGAIYAINVAGAVAGSVLSGFVLLPALGSRASLVIVSMLALTMGLLLLSRMPRGRARLASGAAAIAVFAGVAAFTGDPVIGLLRSRYPAEQPIWRDEDGHATVAILRRLSNFALPVRRLYINGMHQASDDPAMVAYHRTIGTLAAAVHPDPREVLVVGSGGGATPGAIAAFSPNLHVDVVELSSAVVAAAWQFSEVNQGLLARPNVTVRVDDGRNYMLVTDKRYDVITADVILPVHAGAGNLYSAEYYGLMRRVLRNRGIAVQWIGSSTETEYKLIMRTFLSVFPHTTLWHGGSLMVGSTRPLMLDEAAFLAKQRAPESKHALDAAGYASFDALAARFVAGPAEMRAFVGEGPILTDDRPLTEYFLALPQNDRPVDLSKVRGDVHRYVVPADANGSR